MTLPISAIAVLVVGLVSIASIYSDANNKGYGILRRLGRVMGKRTWRVLLIAELNMVLISWFIYSIIVETPVGAPILDPVGTVLRIFVFFSVLSVLAILIERGHIRPPYRTLEKADWLEQEIENADNKIAALDNILQRAMDERSIRDQDIHRLMERLALRDDALGSRAKEYISKLK